MPLLYAFVFKKTNYDALEYLFTVSVQVKNKGKKSERRLDQCPLSSMFRMKINIYL